MHSYAISGSRAKTGGYIMIVAAVVANGLNSRLEILWAYLPLDLPSLTLSIPFTFAALFFIYNKWLWYWPFLSSVAGVPDISGEWVGPLYSSYRSDGGNGAADKPKGSLRPVFTIHQTWSRIEVNGDFAKSRSESTTASFRTDKGNPQLVFTYVNHSRTPEKNDGQHEGVNKLRLATDGDGNDVLEGEYYTDSSRNNHGTMELRRPEDAESSDP
ncbi:hypothetical protein BG842_02885 [Haladaptatus sp. W1]|uniref:Cap15 family cyclic dinucleotide receptor domain-containing protein n=1 Tax=Haladaptatus sp. W1 TaxID=1897478 RepID=UPI0008499306|nr:hypothetical protein [Haladaptatus sp. W1]ODR80196.1 hypothetical protein BG842_02885 [Haladaptatus sp. W1]